MVHYYSIFIVVVLVVLTIFAYRWLNDDTPPPEVDVAVERADDSCRKPCPKNYAPVCGYDSEAGTSRNYSNKCVFSVEQCRNPNLEFVQNGQCPVDTVERADTPQDPLWMIQDADVRAAANTDVDRLLAMYPELPKTDAFRRDVGLFAVNLPTAFGKNRADLDKAAFPILQSILDDHQKYPKEPQRDLQRHIVAMEWANDLGREPTCKDTTTTPMKDTPISLGKECNYGGTIVDRTLAWSALTILWRHGLEWKTDYGIALSSLLLRGSFWPEIYKNKTQKHILLRFGKCRVTTDMGCADPDSCAQYLCDTEQDAQDIISNPGLVCKQGKILKCDRKGKISSCNCVPKV